VDAQGSAATAMLGLPGLVLLAVSEHDGELEQAVESTEAVTGCRVCGIVAVLHDRRPTWVRDLPSGGRPVMIVWVKRVWRCPEPACPVRTWTETSEAIRPRASLTERARREACRRVGEDGHPVAQVAAAFGVGWGAVMRAVAEYGAVLVEDPVRLEAVTRLGVDERAFLAANRAHPTVFVTGIVDLSCAHPRLLDVVECRIGQSLSDWVSARPAPWRAGIEVAALDPFRGYATAPRTHLPAATRVLDAFHVTRLGFATVDEVRRRVRQETTGHRGRRDDPLFRIRRLPRRGHETTTPSGPGHDSSPGSPPATTPASTSGRPGSPLRTCGRLPLPGPPARRAAAAGLVHPLRRRRRARTAAPRPHHRRVAANLHGVSTRKVDDLVKALGADTGISKSDCPGSAPTSMRRSARSRAAAWPGSRSRTCSSTRPTARPGWTAAWCPRRW